MTFPHGYALLIGVGECKTKSLSLKVTVNDTAALARLLVMPDVCAYLPRNVRLLTEQKATKEQILAGLDWLRTCAEQDVDATCLVYYSGHGQYDPASNLYWLVPHDFYSNQPKTRLVAAEFQDRLSAIQPARLLVFIDSCHAGGMAHAKGEEPTESAPLSAPLPEALLTQLSLGRGRAVFTSSSEGESSYYWPNQSMSFFTYHLLEALQGAGHASGAQEVRVGQVLDYLTKTVPDTVRREWDRSQRPRLKGETEGFPIALIRGGKGLPTDGGWEGVRAVAHGTIHNLSMSVQAEYAISLGSSSGPVIQVNPGGVVHIYGTPQEPTKAISLEDNLPPSAPKHASLTIPAAKLKELVELIPRITLGYDQIWACYHAIRVHDPNQLSELPIITLIYDLLSLPRNNNIPPVFEFIERVAWYVQPADVELYEALQTWVTTTASLIDVSNGELASLRRDVVRAVAVSTAPPVIQIDIRPNKLYNLNNTSNLWHYFVEVTLWRSGLQAPDRLYTDEPEQEEATATPRGSLVEQLPILLDKVFAHCSVPANAILEFIVPRELLLADFDRWKHTETKYVTFGTQYPAIVRLRERLELPDNSPTQTIIAFWRKKWQKFAQQLGHLAANEWRWLTDEEAEEPDGFILDWRNDLIHLGVAKMPADKDALFSALRDAGIPVALFARLASEPTTVSALFEAASSQQPDTLKELFWATQRLRQTYPRQPQHIANHLTVLWDDPDRIPPKYAREGALR